jgi:hypothetical protein
MLGITVNMYDYGHQLLGFDLEGVPNLPPRMCAFLSKKGVRVLYPMPGGHARLYIQIKPGEFAEIKRKGTFRWKEELLQETPGLSFLADYLPSDFSNAQLQGACLVKWLCCAQWRCRALCPSYGWPGHERSHY